MAVTKDQIDSFHQFATERISNGGSDMTMRELLQLWALENPTDEEREQVVAIIRQGDKDIEAGNYRPLDEFMEEFRAKNDIPHDA